MTSWFFDQWFVGIGGLIVGLASLHCDARNAHLYSEGLERSRSELIDNNLEYSVLAAFKLVQSG